MYTAGYKDAKGHRQLTSLYQTKEEVWESLGLEPGKKYQVHVDDNDGLRRTTILPDDGRPPLQGWEMFPLLLYEFRTFS